MKRTVFPACPNTECANHTKAGPRWYWRKGTFVTKWNKQPVPRYQCKLCKRNFSSHTFKETYKQKKPYLNQTVIGMLTESSTTRGTARALKTTPATVLAKLEFFGLKAKKICQEKWKEDESKTTFVQFDEIETSHRTQCLPITIAFAVRPKNGHIITAHIGTVPCRNSLARISTKKYGRRKDQRRKAVKAMLHDLTNVVKDEKNFTIASDKWVEYEPW